MIATDQALAVLHDAQSRLFARLTSLDDEMVARPSLLPGWTVGHVLTHIARNADGAVRQLRGAAREEIAEQYPGGMSGRAADIEAGASRSAAELVADVRASGLEVEQAAADVPDDAWERPGRAVDGSLIPIRMVLAGRVREVEVHHVDLDLGYLPTDWPAEFVAQQLLLELPKVVDRTSPVALLGWITGRGPAPDLGPWR